MYSLPCPNSAYVGRSDGPCICRYSGSEGIRYTATGPRGRRARSGQRERPSRRNRTRHLSVTQWTPCLVLLLVDLDRENATAQGRGRELRRYCGAAGRPRRGSEPSR